MWIYVVKGLFCSPAIEVMLRASEYFNFSETSEEGVYQLQDGTSDCLKLGRENKLSCSHNFFFYPIQQLQSNIIIHSVLCLSTWWT